MKFVFCAVLCIVHFTTFARSEVNKNDGKGLLRIIAGKTVNIQDYPYQVSLRRQNNQHYCGGAIISENYIITAAHCVKGEIIQQNTVVTGTSQSNVVGKSYAIESATVHPGYLDDSSYHNDIAVVKLRGSIDLSLPTQRKVKLPLKDYQVGTVATITGWGYTTSTNGQTPINLQKTTATLLSIEQCRSRLPYDLINSQVCANPSKGTGVCSGDSGGPLVADGYLVGIASYVVACGSGQPEVYTNVYKFLDFIKGAMDPNKKPAEPDFPNYYPQFEPSPSTQPGGQFFPNYYPQFETSPNTQPGGQFFPNYYPQFESSPNTQLGEQFFPNNYPQFQYPNFYGRR